MVLEFATRRCLADHLLQAPLEVWRSLFVEGVRLAESPNPDNGMEFLEGRLGPSPADGPTYPNFNFLWALAAHRFPIPLPPWRGHREYYHLPHSRPDLLIVEDEPLIGERIKRALAGKHPTRLATRLSDFESAAREQFPDMILSDLILPDGQTLPLFQKMVPQVWGRFGLMSGAPTLEILLEAISLGGNFMLVKPFTVQKVIETVENLRATVIQDLWRTRFHGTPWCLWGEFGFPVTTHPDGLSPDGTIMQFFDFRRAPQSHPRDFIMSLFQDKKTPNDQWLDFFDFDTWGRTWSWDGREIPPIAGATPWHFFCCRDHAIASWIVSLFFEIPETEGIMVRNGDKITFSLR